MNPTTNQYFATFGFQSAISGSVALAMLALCVARPRRTATYWAVTFALLAVGQTASLLAVRTQEAMPYGPTVALLWGFSFACYFTELYVVVLGTQSLVTDAIAVRVRTLIVVAAVVIGGGIAVWRVVVEAPVHGNFIESSANYVRVTSIAVSLWSAFQLRRRVGWREHVGIRVLSVALLLVAARAMLSLALKYQLLGAGVNAAMTDWLVPLQVIVQVLYGAGALIAVVADERFEALANEQRLQEMERTLLQGQRLEELGRMAGGVAHDFNNLLSVILSSSEMAQADIPPDSPAAVELHSIHVAAERGTSLTRQLLQFARGGETAAVDFDPRARVDTLLPIVRRMLPRNISVASTHEGPSVHVMASVNQFDQVVLNLVANARDAMGSDGVLGIATEAVSDDAGGVPTHFLLRVRDTGGGIPADVLPRIFDPFFSTKSASVGTGLGLATCRAAVDRAGGSIDVHSVVGEGTTVIVQLPVAKAA